MVSSSGFSGNSIIVWSRDSLRPDEFLMDPEQKKIRCPLCLNLRYILEGYYDADDFWHARDPEQ